MNSLAVEVGKLPVRLVPFAGEPFEALVFLHTVGGRRPAPETLGDRLNDPGALFLPCERDETLELLHLAWVAYVEHRGRLPEVDQELRSGALHPRVEVELVTGERLGGELLYSRPPGADRVSDYLNAPGAPFLLVHSEPLTRYVHRRAVVRVRT